MTKGEAWLLLSVQWKRELRGKEFKFSVPACSHGTYTWWGERWELKKMRQRIQVQLSDPRWDLENMYPIPRHAGVDPALGWLLYSRQLCWIATAAVTWLGGVGTRSVLISQPRGLYLTQEVIHVPG